MLIAPGLAPAAPAAPTLAVAALTAGELSPQRGRLGCS